MSLAPDQDVNRRAALNSLKFHKNNKPQSPPQTNSSSSSSTAPEQMSGSIYGTPPQQSRDATVSSRFFPSSTPSLGNVLVPNSSPPPTDSSYRPYHAQYEARTSDTSQIPGLRYTNHWGPSTGASTYNSLHEPSGYYSSAGASHASSSRSSTGMGRGISEVEGAKETERPRKRINLGVDGSPTRDELDLLNNSPGSPDIVRPAAKRRQPARNSGSSDDELPSVSDLTRKRIMRGERPDSQERPASETSTSPAEDPRYKTFAITMPMHPPPRVMAAWKETGGDVSKATALVENPAWSPKSTVKTNVTGKVKEIEAAKEAERAAARERAKKSAIYANRLALPRKTTPPPSSSRAKVEITSPISPLVAPPRQKRPKKRVIESDDESDEGEQEEDLGPEERTLEYFNTAAKEALQELTGCTQEQADKIAELRPFSSTADLRNKLGQGKKKAGPNGISPRMVEDCTEIFEGYGAVDNILKSCEKIGAELKKEISSWSSPSAKGKERSAPAASKASSRDTSVLSMADDLQEDGAVSIRAFGPSTSAKSDDFLVSQPSLLPEGVLLKEYQLLGVNWLALLHRKGLSCILADEMGLGKTIQVISFFAHLKEHGTKGPHLIVVPSSTLENWCREFARFAPDIRVQTYYGAKEDRSALRQLLLVEQCKAKNDGWEVLITTYNLAAGDDRDKKFFRKIDWESCVYDEGHSLKNFQSQRYTSLLRYGSKWRLLLTGTPLQNNLQELVSLMNFILPEHFASSLESLRAIFKTKGDSKVTLLAQERVSRAKKMMTPFVLRRRKDQVLKDLPKKTERIEWCDMTVLQKSIYNDALQRSRKTVFDNAPPAEAEEEPLAIGRSGKPLKKKTKANARTKDKMYLENSSNVLMDLRKAASHPMLFRRRFKNDKLASIARLLVKEPDFKKNGGEVKYMVEDMEVMTDAEIQNFVAQYKSTRKFLQDDVCYLEAGKVTVLLKLLKEYGEQGRRVLIFSQFTQILDILTVIMKNEKIKYLMLTGATPVDVRQALVDEFTEDESIPVFLLSTKAGGMGINLTAASVVIMFDQDFNPHNDRQAQDRAYRIGQTRDVDVIKLITKGTIEEDMLRLGETKLALDEAVAGEVDEEKGGKVESKVEKEVKTSLMNVLRNKFEKEQAGVGEGTGASGGKGGEGEKGGEEEKSGEGKSGREGPEKRKATEEVKREISEASKTDGAAGRDETPRREVDGAGQDEVKPRGEKRRRTGTNEGETEAPRTPRRGSKASSSSSPVSPRELRSRGRK